MRLIDGDELIKEAEKDGAYGYVSAEQIAAFPTAEKRGRWVNDSRWGTTCSVCGFGMYEITGNPYESGNRTRYCPNCGAKMDEVGE